LIVETAGWLEAVETAGFRGGDKAELASDGRRLEISISARTGAPRQVFFRVRPVGVPVTLRGRLGARDLSPADVFVGENGVHPAVLPFALPELDADRVEGLFKPGTSTSGVVVYLDQPSGRAVQDLNPAEREQLCALGYINCSADETRKPR
jgi:hypothetical protein